MGFWQRIKDWLIPPPEPIPESVVDPAPVSEPEQTIEAPPVASSEEDQQLEQIKALLESNDMSNHQLAEMFMMGLNTSWDAEMYSLVKDSADKLTFWGSKEDNEDFLKLVVALRITPRFFGQYSEIADFAKVLPNFVHLKSLRWEAKQYWNQHPILAAASQLPQLEHLHVEDSKMNFLPEYIAQATQLRELHLGGNKLTELPDALEHLPHLAVLDLSGNQFKYCPRVVYHLRRLEVLRLQDNPLENVEPRRLGRLYRLRDLQLPPRLAQFNLETLQDWLPDVDFEQAYWVFEDE